MSLRLQPMNGEKRTELKPVNESLLGRKGYAIDAQGHQEQIECDYVVNILLSVPQLTPATNNTSADFRTDSALYCSVPEKACALAHDTGN